MKDIFQNFENLFSTLHETQTRFTEELKELDTRTKPHFEELAKHAAALFEEIEPSVTKIKEAMEEQMESVKKSMQEDLFSDVLPDLDVVTASITCPCNATIDTIYVFSQSPKHCNNCGCEPSKTSTHFTFCNSCGCLHLIDKTADGFVIK